MLYKDELKLKTEIIKPIIKQFVTTAFDNQTYDQDFFLILINGFYDEGLKKHKIDPFIYGIDYLDVATHSFSEFINWYLKNPAFWRENNQVFYQNSEIEQNKISIHIEKSIYLRYWEADTTLRYLYQMTRLCQKLPYDWQYKQEISKYGNRMEFFRKKIRNSLKEIDENISSFFEETVKSQIRNAIAHSQYCLLNKEIKYMNYSKDPKAYSPISLLSYKK